MTIFTTATNTNSEIGPLRKVVIGFNEVQAKILAAGVKSPSDWEPMGEYLDIASFKRVGAYLEELNFTDYCEFLAGWAAGGTSASTLHSAWSSGAASVTASTGSRRPSRSCARCWLARR